MQRLADGQRRVAQIAAVQLDMQALIQANAQAQFGGVGPVGQGLSCAVVDELDLDAIIAAVDALQLPVEVTHQAVGGRIGRLQMHGLHRLRVALQAAEPRPAHRHTAAHTLAALVGGLLAEPDKRRLVIFLVAEYLRALLADQQLAGSYACAPAGQFVQFKAFNMGSGHWRTHRYRNLKKSIGAQLARRKQNARHWDGRFDVFQPCYLPYTCSGSQVISPGKI